MALFSSGHDRRTVPDAWPMPAFLDIGAGGFRGPSVSVKWRNTGLLFVRHEWDTRYERPESHFTRPSPYAWFRFWEDLDAVGITRWASSYCTPGIRDGSGWSVNVVASGLRVRSQGSNCFPTAVVLTGDAAAGDFGSRDRTPVWNGFCEAVERLSGQEFR